MYSTVAELFLSTYFMFDAIVGKVIGNARILFDKLYSVFLLPELERAGLFIETQEDVVREIESYGDYAQICRIRKFSELTENDAISPEFDEIISIKGNALKRLKQLGFDEYVKDTEAAVCKFLNDTANMGFVPSLCVLGFLQCEGIIITKNEYLGRKNVGKAAVWNSVDGCLLALAYDKDHRQNNLDRLYTVTQGTIYDCLSDAAKDYYVLSDAKFVPESKLLKKAVGLAILKSEVYVPQYARFIFSGVLSYKDKERALFSGHKEAIPETADLPLKLTSGGPVFDLQALNELPLRREAEQDRIIDIVSGADMRTDPAYRPLCICADSDYVLRLYVDAICRTFPSAHIEKIDVSDVGEYDFEPTKNNIFVRSCDEDKHNVFILLCKGEIRENILAMVKNFLQSNKREKFRLQHPSAVIDLSAVLPICFCDKQNARKLKPYCEVVTLAPIREAEKACMLDFIVKEKTKRYHVSDFQFLGAAKDVLAAYSIDRCEYMIDRLMRFNRGETSITVTPEMLKELGRDIETNNKYGFGGAGNEDK